MALTDAIKIDDDIIPEKGRYYNPFTLPPDLTKNEFNILTYLRSKRRKVLVTDISRDLSIQNQTVLVNTRRLSDRGFIEITKEENQYRDKRGKLITPRNEFKISEKGKKYMRNLYMKEYRNDRKDRDNLREEVSSD